MTSTALPLSTDLLRIEALSRAVGRAPSVHNTQPWELAVRHGAVEILQRAGTTLAIHDQDGRDRRMSCGAALAHLELALRSLGRQSTVDIADGGEVAAVLIGGDQPPTPAELALCQAIGARRSYRREFLTEQVPATARTAVLDAGRSLGVMVSELTDVPALAAMLGQATLAFRQDHDYQRELAVWTAQSFGEYAMGAVDGIAQDALGTGALPAAGLIRGDTPVPDDSVLTSRLAKENLVVLCTRSDTHRDQVAAGYALERAWLTATSLGLAGSVITQPLHLTGFRAHLAEREDLPGVPQAFFRFGYPAVLVPPSPRHPIDELFSEGIR